MIVSESYVSPETAALHEEGYEGCLMAGFSRGFLSMSTLGRDHCNFKINPCIEGST